MNSLDAVLIPMQKNIKPLNMNDLNGRMLRFSATKGNQRDILLVYGHHASLERAYGIAEALSDFGSVTAPDLPGFGGMDSFYKIGMKPSIDNFADYLASFIKLRYRGRKITIVAMSLGFVIVTRMLQRYPEMKDKVDLLVSIVGFSHKYDMTFSRPRYLFYRYGASFFSRKLTSKFFYNVFLHPSILKRLYSKSHNAKSKFDNLSKEDRDQIMEFEVKLWRENDLRTHMDTSVSMLTLDNCKVQVDLPVHHVSVSSDQYFDHNVVEQHMRVIFNDFTEHVAEIPNHAPSILASKEEAYPFIPQSIRKVFKKLKR
jgi:pimeloyl-ACP methyl ester carboxylesterase